MTIIQIESQIFIIIIHCFMPKKELLEILVEINSLETNVFKLMKSNCHRPAIDFLKNILYLNPNHSIAYYLLAECYGHQQEKQKEEKLKKIAVKVSPASQIFNASPNPLQESLQLLEETTRIITGMQGRLNEQSYWASLIKAYAKKMEYPLAGWAIQVIQSSCSTKSCLLSRSLGSQASMVLFHIGKYDHNLKLIRSQSQLFGSGALRYANTSVLAYLSNDDELARKYVDLCFECDPNFVRGLYILSFILARTGQAQQAIEELQRSLLTFPKAMVYRSKLIILLILHHSHETLDIKEHLSFCQRVIRYKETEDKIVMEDYWYPFMYFCCEFLMREAEKGKLNDPYVIEFVRLWNQFIIRGNMERASYSFKMIKFCEKYLSKSLMEYWNFNLNYERCWNPYKINKRRKQK